MAKVQMIMPDDYLERLSKLEGKTDEITEKVLEAGAKAVLPILETNLEKVIGKDTKYDSRSTGELQRSLGISSVRIDRAGNFNVKIGFAEPRSDGGSNAKLANIIEYGKHGQPAKPFLKPTKTKSKKVAEQAMKNKFDEEVSKL